MRMILLNTLAFFATAAHAAGIPAFPGAEGFGTTTPGGRGGVILKVTHLNDAGPGSLRAALTAAHSRIVVFDVGGTITLESDITISHPFCTIAGQTAPGGGICIRGAGINIPTHDVIVRHLRVRMGRLPESKINGFRDGIDIVGRPSPYNIVLDHCSISWATSRALVTWDEAHDITVQWSILSEGMKNPEGGSRAFGGMGFLIGDHTKRISVHHCLFAHNYQRNPRLKHGAEADLSNNVVYNWGGKDFCGASMIGDFERNEAAAPVRANVINCWYQAGADTGPDIPVLQALTRAELYTAGNVADRPWLPANVRDAMKWITLLDRPIPAPPVTVLPVQVAYEQVLEAAGATRPRRDAVDTRVVREVRAGQGRHVSGEQDVGGWPELDPGEPWTDTDGDGMPDDWERVNRLDPNDPNDAHADNDGDGYTNVEEWINELGGAPMRKRPSADTSSSAAPAPSGAKVYGVGILGNCCTHGSGLARRFTDDPRTRVVTAYERNPRRAKELQERLGSPLAESYEAVIRHPDVDFVAIACDPCDKADRVEQAAAAGKPIFLNKPLCESLDSARRMAAAVKAHNVPFVHDIPMVRFIPVYARLLHEVQAGKYGEVMGYHHLFGMNFAPDFDLAARWPERLDPAGKSGGGEMTNMGCYAIDFAVSLFGEPESVTAKWRKTWDVYRKADVENFGQIMLDYGQFFAFLEVGKQQLQGDRRHANEMTIIFEHTTLHIDASAEQVTINHVPQDYAVFTEGATATDSIDQIIAAIEQDVPPTSDLDTAVLATEVLMAAYRSIIEDRTIPLPLQSGENPLAARVEK